MRFLIFVTIAVLSVGEVMARDMLVRDEEYFTNCLAEGMQSDMTAPAMKTLSRICDFRSVPKKCRAIEDEESSSGKNFFDRFDKSSGLFDDLMTVEKKVKLDQCIRDCRDANYFSRKFGDCSFE